MNPIAPLRIVLADDHALVRAGIRALVESVCGVAVVGEAVDGYDALRLIGELRPDIALLDISMPAMNGLETLERVVKEQPQTRVVMLSMHAASEYVGRALRSGAAGYLSKNAERGELELALRAVARGETWLSPSISTDVVAAYVRGDKPPPGPSELLTTRQRHILQLVAEGGSTKEIASRLRLSVKTVDTHRAQLKARLGVHDVPGLVRYAIRNGIVSNES
ncbi:MAG: two component transcriptional regulator, LuxR family [Myxococcaceae bacterium]|jgi:DNA-binding NarL/FixJ family response regulator|nr:two component transcriptional regulator, LuxR family [Myxococcaceae bacterium]